MNPFNNIIQDSDFFLDVPDCVADGVSYKEKIEKALALVGDGYHLEDFSWGQIDKKFKLSMVTKGTAHTFELSKVSDFVDGINLCKGVN